MTLPRTTVPASLEEAVSTAWLSSVLGAEVTAVTLGEVDTRVSTNAPVTADLADGTRRRLWVKGYFSEVGRFARFAGVPEAMFYRELVERTGIRTLRAVFAATDPETQENIIVTDDVLGEGAVFLDSLSEYTVDQAAASLEQLAVLHASTWLDPACAAADWLASRLENYTVTRGVDDIEVNFGGPIGSRVPERVRDAERLYAAFSAMAADVAEADPWCVMHGDAHIGNIYLDGDGRPCFVDWQLVQRGPWFIDVGYHLASALTVDDRRRNEEDLVRHYLDRLRAGGVDVPFDDDVWRGVRRGFVHGFYLWGITLKVFPPKTAALLERLGSAVDDHDAFEEVGL